MYSHLLPELAAERARDIRRGATGAALIRLSRGARHGRRPGRAAAAVSGRVSRLLPRTARA